MLAWTLSSLAWAAPVVEATEDGAVRGSVEVHAGAPTVAAVLQEPEAWYAIARPGAAVTVQPDPDPACHRVEVSTPHPILPTTYVARDCWTGDGVTSVLVDSAQLAELESTWEVEPHGDHAIVTFRLYVRLRGAYPSVLVRASTKRGVVAALSEVEAAFAAPHRRGGRSAASRSHTAATVTPRRPRPRGTFPGGDLVERPSERWVVGPASAALVPMGWIPDRQGSRSDVPAPISGRP